MDIMYITCGFLSKTLVSRISSTKPLGKDKFVWKILFVVITWNEKNSSKEVVSMINTLGKDFFAAATFQALWDASFETKWERF